MLDSYFPLSAQPGRHRSPLTRQRHSLGPTRSRCGSRPFRRLRPYDPPRASRRPTARAKRPAEKAGVGIRIDHPERFGERWRLRMRCVAVPLQVGALPEDAPCASRAHVGESHDGLLHMPRRIEVKRAHIKQLNGLAVDALAFAHHLPQMQRRPTLGPELAFEGGGVGGNFVFGEGHGITWRGGWRRSRARSMG